MGLIIATILLLIVVKCYTKFSTRWCESKVCLLGKTTIVTGANTGIGFETAKDFASRGARVILACRNEEKANEARDLIIKATKNENVVVRVVDFNSLESVRNFAKVILKTEDRLDILVNNAGVGSASNRLTEDGLQVCMQVNYFGSVLLTMLLLDLLKKSAPSRIVNVSSMLANFAKLTAENLNEYPGPYMIYNNSKLGNILFTQRLAKLLKNSGVSVFSIHPGAIRTDIFRKFQGFRKVLLGMVMSVAFKTAEEGAQTTLSAALEPEIESLSGSHFENCKPVRQYSKAKDEELEKAIWAKTMKLFGYEGEHDKIAT